MLWDVAGMGAADGGKSMRVILRVISKVESESGREREEGWACRVAGDVDYWIGGRIDGAVWELEVAIRDVGVGLYEGVTQLELIIDIDKDMV
jgi:hypothetical protein